MGWAQLGWGWRDAPLSPQGGWSGLGVGLVCFCPAASRVSVLLLSVSLVVVVWYCTYITLVTEASIRVVRGFLVEVTTPFPVLYLTASFPYMFRRERSKKKLESWRGRARESD